MTYVQESLGVLFPFVKTLTMVEIGGTIEILEQVYIMRRVVLEEAIIICGFSQMLTSKVIIVSLPSTMQILVPCLEETSEEWSLIWKEIFIWRIKTLTVQMEKLQYL